MFYICDLKFYYEKEGGALSAPESCGVPLRVHSLDHLQKVSLVDFIRIIIYKAIVKERLRNVFHKT